MPLATQNPVSSNIEFSIEGIKVIFFPSNTTSLVQPLDQGTLRTFKTHYIWYFMERTINAVGKNPDRENMMKV